MFEVPSVTDLNVQCGICRQMFAITVTTDDYEEWKAGAFVQRAFPYLTAAQRELLISKTCGPCFDRLFADD